MEVKSIKEAHTELMMHSVRFAKDEQGRRKGQESCSSGRISKSNWASTSIFTSSTRGWVRTITRTVCGTT